jgi:hypothetical protein
MKSLNRLTIILLLLMSFSSSKYDNNTNEIARLNVTDAGDNIYNTITIANQIWMFENLKTSTYCEGKSIVEYSFGLDWYNGNTLIAYYQSTITGDFNNIFDKELPLDYYGNYYNHTTIKSGKLAPKALWTPTQVGFDEMENDLTG